jgi:hypothetical protein
VSGNPILLIDPDGLLVCKYQIFAHTLECTNKKGQSLTISGTGVKSGQGKCQDNPQCIDRPDEGPLPTGNYTIYSASQTRSKSHPSWMFLGPDSANQMHNRGGFFIHPWGVSNGCITIFFNSDFRTLSRWAEEDNGGRLNVAK